MVYVDWSIKGPEVTNCNCAQGCPCQFNALPTYGDCRATTAMRIDEGHFGDVNLDGLHWVTLFAWPGAVHEGNGEALLVVDERADDDQRAALLKILSGEETEPGATFFNVFASTMTKVHEPLFLPIKLEIDVAGRKSSFSVKGVVEASSAPITNPITGNEHQVRVTLPHGFEYTEAEYASGTAKSGHPIPLDWEGRHSHLANLHLNAYGPVR